MTARGRKQYVVGLSIHMLLHPSIGLFILFVWTWLLKNILGIVFKLSVIAQFD